MGRRQGGLSLRVKRDERVGGLVVGWGGCECHGLVSNTLSLSMSATSTHPSMVNHSPVCFKSHCVCCHFNQCVGASVLSHFCPLSNPLLFGNCHLIDVCTMSRVCAGFVGVCCVMSSDGVWGVDDAVCVLLSTPKKKAAQHTALFACDGVHQCVMLCGE